MSGPGQVGSRNGATPAVAIGAFLVAGLAASLMAPPATSFAQSSPSHTLSETVFNSGGRPAQGTTAASPSFRLNLDSIGEPLASTMMGSPSFRIDGGLAAGYLPPGEVEGVQVLADRQTIAWGLEPASIEYNVYRALLSSLPGEFGACFVGHVASTSLIDVATPGPGEGLFYLVTGVNRLREEGTKGRTSSGAVRSNPLPCP